jgi:adenine deaminase
MSTQSFQISGKIVDVVAGKILGGTITVKNGKIVKITPREAVPDHYILPGLIDAHIHIESSMLIPSEFARVAVVHGTVAAVSDPHEIANVLGMEGIRFMIRNGKKVPFKFFFGAPSCVPATPFESSGAEIGVREIEDLLGSGDIYYLSEMMNFPGVLFDDPTVAKKLALARKAGKPVDGHAPGLTGEQAEKYIKEGITTDHECYTLEEAVDKISKGMKILIREGSAAKNFEELSPLIDQYPGQVMFCSDDKHPNDLLAGHINDLVKRSLAKGYDLFNILRCCTVNPVRHYKLDTGLLQEGDAADFIIINDLENFNVLETFINGEKVAEKGSSLILAVSESPINHFHAQRISPEDIRVKAAEGTIRIIHAFDGQLITKEITARGKMVEGFFVSDPDEDILKIVVKDRYHDSPPAMGFIKGFGIKTGAIASSVAHDSHNIIAVGTDDVSIAEAINLVIAATGGISLVTDNETRLLKLPFAGIMTDEDAAAVASAYDSIDGIAKGMGSSLKAPFMTLSFMALLVIPEIKISDKGLFDSVHFTFTDVIKPIR